MSIASSDVDRIISAVEDGTRVLVSLAVAVSVVSLILNLACAASLVAIAVGVNRRAKAA